jgi:hypothetical protein
MKTDKEGHNLRAHNVMNMLPFNLGIVSIVL